MRNETTHSKPLNESVRDEVSPRPESYTPPAMYVIGRSSELLQGSGRHKNDDTGNPGFEVDQH